MPEKNIKRFVYAPETPMSVVISDLYRKSITICLVCDPKGKLLGVITLADIKQALLKGVDPQSPIRHVMNTAFVSAPATASLPELRKLAKRPTKYGTGLLNKIPLVHSDQRLAGLYVLTDKGARETSTVLVTGGAGYIGSHLCRQLLKEGYRVIVLDKLVFGDQGIRDLYTHKNFSFIEGDIADIGTLMDAVQQADFVVHLAGIVGDPASGLRPLQTMEENHFATTMLVDLCRHYQVSRFVFASSCSVYGASDKRLSEKSSLNPVSLYAQSKMYSERELLRAAGENFHPVILRFGTIYGLSPRMRFDLVANTMTAHAFFNKKITVDGGSQWRPMLHVEDAARACLAALKAPREKVAGEIFNVGDSKENYQISEIAQAVTKSLPYAAIVSLDTVKDRRNYHVSFAKINKIMKFKTKRTLREGIAEMAREMRKGKFKDWKKSKYSNYLTLRSTLEKDPSVIL